MRTICFLILSLAWMAGHTQTQKIAFKSHSGDPANFSSALENDLFEMEEAGFGLPEYKVLDSVILIGDSAAVLVTKKDNSSAKSRLKRDTLRSNPLFLKTNSLDSIKKDIHHVFWFSNKVETVKFVGFDSTPVKEKKNIIPYAGTFNNDNNRPFDGQVIWITAAILLLSVLAGLLTWKYKPVQWS
jgi:hypothetical protein